MQVVDNYDLFEQHEAEQERRLQQMPICSECGEHITDDEYYEFDDSIICSDCLKDNHRRWIEDYQ